MIPSLALEASLQTGSQVFLVAFLCIVGDA